MSVVYDHNFEAVFLCTHPQGSRMTYIVAAKLFKEKRTFVKKWVDFLYFSNLYHYFSGFQQEYWIMLNHKHLPFRREI